MRGRTRYRTFRRSPSGFIHPRAPTKPAAPVVGSPQVGVPTTLRGQLGGSVAQQGVGAVETSVGPTLATDLPLRSVWRTAAESHARDTLLA